MNLTLRNIAITFLIVMAIPAIALSQTVLDSAGTVRHAPDTIIHAVKKDTADTKWRRFNHRVPASPTYMWKIEGVATTSSSRTPFWLMNNRLGLSSTAQNNGYLRAGFFMPLSEEKRFSYGYGADLVIPYNFTSKYVIQQLYAEFKYRSLRLTIGSKERYEGVVDQELSSGDLTFSLNSRPIPQVYISMPEYQWVPLTNKWVSFKGFFSLGCFTDGRWQKHYVGQKNRWAEKVLYHSKGFWLKAGNLDRFPVTVEGGLEMAAQFGGELQLMDPVTHKPYIVKVPSKLKDWWKAIIPMGSESNGNPALEGEALNVYGNHVGQWSAAVTYAPKDSGWQLRAYYEHFFDDHSQLFLEHGWHDMLLGVTVSFPRNSVIDRFLYEYIYTKDQSGSVYWDSKPDIPEQISGRDDYYNHYMYPGWQHWGMGMGNPLLISPIYNGDGNLEFMHTRIKGHHFGLVGHPADEIDYKIMMSLTRSWGTYPNPTPSIMHNFNALLEIGYSPAGLSGWHFRLGFGADAGKLLGKSVGAMLTIRKTGWL